MAKLTGLCSLCLSEDIDLVNSHIIPRSFYEEYKGKPLIAFSANSKKSSTIRKGIYGNFLCNNCEAKFSKIDNCACDLIKRRIDWKSVAKDDLGRELSIIEDAYANKNLLHKFALSVLWRAKQSNRQEYEMIKIGTYEERIRVALLSDQFDQSLLDATGLWLFEFRDSVLPKADVIGYSYRKLIRSERSTFFRTYGNFTVHVFGYPYGEILMRLGGEKPKRGYFEHLEGVKALSVFWSTNLSENYPNLVVCKMPRVRKDGHQVGDKCLKYIFNVLLKNRVNLE